MLNKILLFLLFFILNSFAQPNEKSELVFTGNLKVDANQIPTQSQQKVFFNLPEENKKKPFLAGLMSLAIPGLGEFYSESYIKAGIFAALEISAIVVGLTYDKKGDDQTDFFQNHADKYWSVVKYAEWLNIHRSAGITINPDANLPPWERVNWSELNAAESGFSHKLPHHGDQQYYELIGKYPQYSSGWSQFDNNNPNYNDVPSQLVEYAAMRGKANDYYNVATKAVIAIYINHFLSALDAVWSAIQYNHNLNFSVRVKEEKIGYTSILTPELKLRYSF